MNDTEQPGVIHPMVNLRIDIAGGKAEEKLSSLPDKIKKLTEELPGLNFVDIHVSLSQ